MKNMAHVRNFHDSFGGIETKEDGGASSSAQIKAGMEDLQSQMHEAFNELKTTNDAELKAHDAVHEEKLTKIDETLNELQSNFDELIRKAQRPAVFLDTGHGEQRQLSEDEVEHQKAFQQHMKKGTEAFEAGSLEELQEKVGLVVGNDPNGGYFVTPTVEMSMDRTITETSPIRSIASVRQIGTDRWERPYNQGGTIVGWVGEVDDRDNTANSNVRKTVIPVHEMYGNPKASQSEIDDANINIEQWLVDEVGIEFGALEGIAFCTGNGVAQPKGIFNQTGQAETSGAKTYANDGKIGWLKTGVNGAFAAADPADVLFDMIERPKPGMLQGSRFLTSRFVFTLMRKFKDDHGNYLWEPSLKTGAPTTFLGFPVTLADDAPALSTNGFSLAFGNFQRGYYIIDRTGTRVLRDPYTDKPYVSFYTTRRVGGDVYNFEAYKYLKFAA